MICRSKPSPAPARNRTGRDGLAGRLLPLVLIALAVPAVMPVAAHAQSDLTETTEARLRRIEGQMRALQRKVFPDGAGKSFAPEIAPGEAVVTTAVPTGNAGAIADVLARMDAVEAQMRALTAGSEDTQNRLGKLESRVGAVETAQSSAAAAATPPPAVAAADGDAPPPAPQSFPVGKPGRRDVSGASSTPAAGARSAAVAAIVRPATDDKGEDAYLYGYHLWEAKFFPEAEAVLLDFVQQYPNHKRISYARNLLGRAYLDDNKPGASAQWFAQNYRADKTGDRAPDSLLYLAVAMTRLKETKRACIALGEFRQTYPNEAVGRLKGQYDAATKTVTCN